MLQCKPKGPAVDMAIFLGVQLMEMHWISGKVPSVCCQGSEQGCTWQPRASCWLRSCSLACFFYGSFVFSLNRCPKVWSFLDFFCLFLFCTLLLRVEILTLKQTAHISQIITTKVAYSTLNKVYCDVQCYKDLSIYWHGSCMSHESHACHMAAGVAKLRVQCLKSLAQCTGCSVQSQCADACGSEAPGTSLPCKLMHLG